MQYPQPNCGSYTNTAQDGNTAKAIKIMGYDPTVLHQPGFESTPERCINFDFVGTMADGEHALDHGRLARGDDGDIVGDRGLHLGQLQSAGRGILAIARVRRSASMALTAHSGMPSATAALTPLPTVWAGPVGFGGPSLRVAVTDDPALTLSSRLGANYNQPLGWDPTKVLCRALSSS